MDLHDKPFSIKRTAYDGITADCVPVSPQTLHWAAQFNRSMWKCAAWLNQPLIQVMEIYPLTIITNWIIWDWQPFVTWIRYWQQLMKSLPVPVVLALTCSLKYVQISVFSNIFMHHNYAGAWRENRLFKIIYSWFNKNA